MTLQVVIMTHEAAKMTELEDYFANKFFPINPVYLIGRSYKLKPECKPAETLYDSWTELNVCHPFDVIGMGGMTGGGMGVGWSWSSEDVLGIEVTPVRCCIRFYESTRLDLSSNVSALL